MDWKYEFDKWKENMAFKIADMLPRWLVYYASIRLMVHATTGKYGHEETPAILGVDALKRWEK